MLDQRCTLMPNGILKRGIWVLCLLRCRSHHCLQFMKAWSITILVSPLNDIKLYLARIYIFFQTTPFPPSTMARELLMMADTGDHSNVWSWGCLPEPRVSGNTQNLPHLYHQQQQIISDTLFQAIAEELTSQFTVRTFPAPDCTFSDTFNYRLYVIMQVGHWPMVSFGQCS